MGKLLKVNTILFAILMSFLEFLFADLSPDITIQHPYEGFSRHVIVLNAEMVAAAYAKVLEPAA